MANGLGLSGKLKKVSVQGGAPVTLTNAADVGASCGEDGNIVFSASQDNGLLRISASGGTAQPLTKFNAGEATHRYPQVLSGAEAVLFTVHSSLSGFDTANIEVLSVKSGQRKTLVRGGYFGRYIPSYGATGHLVYMRGGC